MDGDCPGSCPLALRPRDDIAALPLSGRSRLERVASGPEGLGEISYLVGCGAGSACSNALGSRWSQWFLIPVSALSLLLYATLFFFAFRPSKSALLAEYFDYTCDACRNLHVYLNEFMVKHPRELCVLEGGSREVPCGASWRPMWKIAARSARRTGISKRRSFW